MKMPTALLLGGLSLISATARADDDIPPVKGGKTYVQHLITLAKARHPGVTAIVVEGRREGDKATVILGSTLAPATVFRPVGRPAPDHGAMARGGSYVVHSPYLSSTGHPIGTVTTMFRMTPGQRPAALAATADRIAHNLAQATLSAKNAADPYPYDPAWGPNTYAQRLTERTIARHPDLLVMMIHATPPGGAKNLIIGSNIGRLGKIADDDDTRVIDKGETNLEIGGEKDRFETELPLNRADGTRIGALGLVFRYRDGDDREAIHRHGLAIRDEIAAQIPDSAALFKPAR